LEIKATKINQFQFSHIRKTYKGKNYFQLEYKQKETRKITYEVGKVEKTTVTAISETTIITEERIKKIEYLTRNLLINKYV
jgi:hypothetical protein